MPLKSHVALLDMLLNPFFFFFPFQSSSVLAINSKIETVHCKEGFHKSDNHNFPSSQCQCAALVCGGVGPPFPRSLAA